VLLQMAATTSVADGATCCLRSVTFTVTLLRCAAQDWHAKKQRKAMRPHQDRGPSVQLPELRPLVSKGDTRPCAGGDT
jgi:hypothetical protein